MVTPRVGVWIEMPTFMMGFTSSTVTPRVGVWIEIHNDLLIMSTVQSHTPRGCVD